LITVLMTAFYSFRVVFLTFGGDYKGGSHEAHGAHPHESPPVMVIPMVVLSVLAIFSGFWNIGGGFNAFMGEGETHGFFEGLFGIFTHSPLPLISLAVAGLGIFLAYAIYGAKWLSAERIGSLFPSFYNLFLHKYFMDELYENIIVKVALLKGLFAGLEYVDGTKIQESGEAIGKPNKNLWQVDGIVNGVANGAVAGGRGLRRAQTGQLQLYGLVMGIGIVAIILVVYLFG
ncbi:MAG: NADH-quinone oxidoreductase subunit L, partial [Dehalococcoidales bacterium]|nr:NADH-quinone oxidoreductase subunit L [Dehalococcoidales bacterium]